MSDDEFCTPAEAQKIQGDERRKLFPNAPAEIPCKLCRMMMPNPVIEYGAFSSWCIACVRSRCSKKAVRRMVRKEQEAPTESGKSQLAGVAPPRPAAERMAPNSAGITTTNGKPQLPLSSYLTHG